MKNAPILWLSDPISRNSSYDILIHEQNGMWPGLFREASLMMSNIGTTQISITRALVKLTGVQLVEDCAIVKRNIYSSNMKQSPAYIVKWKKAKMCGVCCHL